MATLTTDTNSLVMQQSITDTLPSQRTGTLSGAEKIAILLNVIGEEGALDVFKRMTNEEVSAVSHMMEQTKSYTNESERMALVSFMTAMSRMTMAMKTGSSSSLAKDSRFEGSELGDQLSQTEENSTWENLARVHEEILANYLKNEYPQAVAVIMTKLKPDQAARVLALLPEEFSADVITRMLSMDSVKKEVLIDIERTLRTEFVNTATSNSKSDMHSVVAEIFNRLERGADAKFLTVVEKVNSEAAERIRDLMFTFEDLSRLSASDIRILLRHVDRTKLSIALKGTTEDFRGLFTKNMPERAARLLNEAIVDLGAVRLREVEEAQMDIVAKAKELAAQGEIALARGEADEMVS